MDDIGSGSEASQRVESTPNLHIPTPSILQMESDHSIKILLATDNHIGYAESDPIRGQDSINTFREILQLAIDHDVDMLLLAGDLFHHNRPSRASLYSTIASLREFCLNHRPIRVELIGDAGVGLPHGFNFPAVNYEDENLNVGLPVFSIHGNHDDPQGIGPEGALCALDVLSASGLINYFGRQELPGNAQNDEEALEEGLHIQPVLLQKGRTRLAMYGIGNIRDERFHFEMRSNRIRMSKPVEYRDEWFNMMLVHQNRVAHGPKNSVPENGFGDDIDLLIWGHEHDCLIQPQEVAGRGYFITQPGSSIATSLSKGESIQKHVAILQIQDRDFSLIPLPLKTVRPFIFRDIVLSDEEEEHNLKLDTKALVLKYLTTLVGELIKQAHAQWDELHVDDNPPPARMLPLIRLRVEYTRSDGQGAYEVGNPQRFGQDFLGKIANPKDVIQFYRKKKMGIRKAKNDIDIPENEMIPDSQGRLTDKVEKIQVSTLVHQYLEAQNLGVLAENGMQKAVSTFVEKDDKDAIKMFYNKALKATQAFVNEENSQATNRSNKKQDRDVDSDDEEIVEQLARAKEVYADAWEKADEAKSKGKNKGKAPVRRDEESDDSDFGRMPAVNRDDEDDEDEDELNESLDVPQRGKSTAPKKTGGRDLFRASESESGSEVSVVAPQKKKAPPVKKTAPVKKAPAVRKAPAKKGTSKKSASGSGTQTTLSFSHVPVRGQKQAVVVDDDDDIDDESEDDRRSTNKRSTTGRSRQ